MKIDPNNILDFIEKNISLVTNLINIYYREKFTESNIIKIMKSKDKNVLEFRSIINDFLLVEVPRMKKLYGTITQKDLTDLELLEMLNEKVDPETETFITPLSDLSDNSIVDNLIEEFNLECIISIVEIDGEEYVQEEFESKEHQDINIKRIYPFDDIEEAYGKTKQVEIYQMILDKALIDEKYEVAAKYRDKINNLCLN